MSVISLEEWRKKLENTSTSQSLSKLSTELAEIGQKPIEELDEGKIALIAIAMVVDTTRIRPFTTKSNFARMAANEIAIAASEGFISTKLREGEFTNSWMVTMEGLQFLEEVMDEIITRH